jgi:hypothetical protein
MNNLLAGFDIQLDRLAICIDEMSLLAFASQLETDHKLDLFDHQTLQ